MTDKLKRISLMLREDQQLKLSKLGINLSGLVRDLIDDHLSDYKITLGVSEETRVLYDKIISNTGSTDSDVEVYFRDSLKVMLSDRIKSMQKLEKSLK